MTEKHLTYTVADGKPDFTKGAIHEAVGGMRRQAKGYAKDVKQAKASLAEALTHCQKLIDYYNMVVRRALALCDLLEQIEPTENGEIRWAEELEINLLEFEDQVQVELQD